MTADHDAPAAGEETDRACEVLWNEGGADAHLHDTLIALLSTRPIPSIMCRRGRQEIIDALRRHLRMSAAPPPAPLPEADGELPPEHAIGYRDGFTRAEQHYAPKLAAAIGRPRIRSCPAGRRGEWLTS